MPNIIAYLALFIWPVVAILLFRLLPLQKALVWTIIGGYLLLPTATYIKFPMLPPIDKTMVASVPSLLLCLLMAPRQPPNPASLARTGRHVLLDLDGGVLEIDWRADGVWMSGPVAHVFDGWLSPDYLAQNA